VRGQSATPFSQQTVVLTKQQFPEARESQHSSGIPTCLFVNRHAKIGLS
jgi:hypothetical protein